MGDNARRNSTGACRCSSTSIFLLFWSPSLWLYLLRALFRRMLARSNFFTRFAVVSGTYSAVDLRSLAPDSADVSNPGFGQIFSDQLIGEVFAFTASLLSVGIPALPTKC
jgi:hypothetical protein